MAKRGLSERSFRHQAGYLDVKYAAVAVVSLLITTCLGDIDAACFDHEESYLLAAAC